jgi:hypothetical protein
MEKIKENMDGKRDDDVMVAKNRDERNNVKDGFGALFGSGNNISECSS